jgi:ribosomal protein S18 acetylase RimI-like enzyme
MKEITFRKAERNEFERVLSFLKEAALWLRDKGVDYWQDWIDPPANFVDWIRQGFDENQFYMVGNGDEVIGCFRLQWEDRMFWGEQETTAGYVHSLTISRKLAGRGIGTKVLKLIESYCREKKKEFLRLDCGVDIMGLRKYYERCGFEAVGEVTVEGERLTLYEKRVC